nr:histidine kinase N-terminal 7TM domain-containing protein [Halorubellus sp. JP-L1]
MVGLYAALLAPVIVGLCWVTVALRRTHPDKPGATALAVALVGAAGYTAFDVAELLATTTDVKYAFFVAQTVPFELIGPAVLVFSLEYTGANRYVTRRFIAALAVVPTVTVALVLAEPVAGVGLYFGDLTAVPWQATLPVVGWSTVGRTALAYDAGPWFYVDTAYALALAALAASQFLVLWLRSTGMYRRQGRLLCLAVVVPMVAGAANVLLVPNYPIDLVPPTFAVTWFAVAFALYRRDLLAVVPVDPQSLIDQLPEAVFVVDPQDRIVQANTAATSLLVAPTRDGLVGASAARAVRATFDEALADVADGDVIAVVDEPETPDAVAADDDTDATAADTDATADDDTDVTAADTADAADAADADTAPDDGPEPTTDGGAVPATDERFEARIRSVTDARGRQRGRLFLLYDVTDRVSLERRIREQYDQLTVLNRLLRHDIQNDVAIALGWGEQLADELDDDDPAREHLETVLAANRHIEDLTLVARDIAEALVIDEDLELKRIRLDTALEEAVSKAQARFAHATIHPPTFDEPVFVDANETLGSVFTNLVNNAVQHNDDEHPTVDVTATVTADRVRVRVADDGPGIPETQRARIFGRGEKGLASDGTGLGLYLVDNLVDQFGGDVTIADADDLGGTAFVVDLPRTQ